MSFSATYDWINEFSEILHYYFWFVFFDIVMWYDDTYIRYVIHVYFVILSDQIGFYCFFFMNVLKLRFSVHFVIFLWWFHAYCYNLSVFSDWFILLLVTSLYIVTSFAYYFWSLHLFPTSNGSFFRFVNSVLPWLPPLN